MVRSSLNAHNSASKLKVTPILLEKPTTQLPNSSLIRPPPPAKPELPRDDPSVFCFLQSSWPLPSNILHCKTAGFLPIRGTPEEVTGLTNYMVCQVWVGITILENYFVPLLPYHPNGKKEDYVLGRFAGTETLIIPCIHGQPSIKITCEKTPLYLRDAKLLPKILTTPAISK